ARWPEPAKVRNSDEQEASGVATPAGGRLMRGRPDRRLPRREPRATAPRTGSTLPEMPASDRRPAPRRWNAQTGPWGIAGHRAAVRAYRRRPTEPWNRGPDRRRACWRFPASMRRDADEAVRR